MSMQIYADKPYAVFKLPIENELESTVYAMPACTAWLEDITIKVSAKDGKQVTFAALCKWPPDELKLSDYLEKRKKPTVNWITYENSDKDGNIKHQRIVTRRYNPPLILTSMNRRKHTIYSSDSDSDIELQAPIQIRRKRHHNFHILMTLATIIIQIKHKMIYVLHIHLLMKVLMKI
ncbi:uncharacterized protein LOC112590339 isoform X3 [Harpegnathos saltator]|uniref:uncharacterized protein LOC112590339 isoform X3 n=1 Tax=Harpegnathos saltator TaxID=610380 RepID=UPI000DBEE838|nr:uncharacterized protein LOC112590339 isoform X3 [Harpegnathos saltator]